MTAPHMLKHPTSWHVMLRNRNHLLRPRATDNANSDLTDSEALTDIDETQMVPVVEQGLDGDVEVDVAVTTAPTTSASTAASDQQQHARRHAQQSQRLVRASVSPEFVEKAKFAGVLVVGAAVVAGAVFMLRKVANTQMPKVQKVLQCCCGQQRCVACECMFDGVVGCVAPYAVHWVYVLCTMCATHMWSMCVHPQHTTQVMEQRQLQKESMQRLNAFMEQVCVVVFECWCLCVYVCGYMSVCIRMYISVCT